MQTLSFVELQNLVTREGVAIRVHQRLQPAGGEGDKIFPPTYATGDNKLKYAQETRRIGGQDVNAVLLDSVAAQANRIEEALFSAWERNILNFPVIGVDFTEDSELADLGIVTTLHAPHRIADAILRDAISSKGSLLFRETPQGQAFTEATAKNATAVFLLCPTALILGVWDSTGPKGGLGAKFQRALTSEIVAIGATPGVKVKSRLDPLGIQANVLVYEHQDDKNDWTTELEEAKKDKNKAVLFSRKGSEGKGKASSVNHSTIAPSIDVYAGGITFDYAVQTVVLSLPALRKLRFIKGMERKPLPLPNPDQAANAARVALAALALAGIVHQRAQGYDLRSRCLLVADAPLILEIVRADGSVTQAQLSLDESSALLEEARQAAAAAGLAWERQPMKLKPSPKLSLLIQKSRANAAAGEVEDA